MHHFASLNLLILLLDGQIPWELPPRFSPPPPIQNETSNDNASIKSNKKLIDAYKWSYEKYPIVRDVLLLGEGHASGWGAILNESDVWVARIEEQILNGKFRFYLIRKQSNGAVIAKIIRIDEPFQHQLIKIKLKNKKSNNKGLLKLIKHEFNIIDSKYAPWLSKQIKELELLPLTIKDSGRCIGGNSLFKFEIFSRQLGLISYVASSDSPSSPWVQWIEDFKSYLNL